MCQGFFDNDIFIKLAGCQLIESACQQLKIKERWVLSSLKHQITVTNKSKSGRLAKYFASLPENIQNQVIDAINNVKKLQLLGDQKFINSYTTEYSFDIGEIQLLDAALNTNDSFLFTGDKRFLKQLAENSNLYPQVLKKLPRCFACLESILLCLIDNCGFEFVRDKVLPIKEFDGQIKIVFGGGQLKTETQSRETLEYELNLLGEKVKCLLHYKFG